MVYNNEYKQADLLETILIKKYAIKFVLVGAAVLLAVTFLNNAFGHVSGPSESKPPEINIVTPMPGGIYVVGMKLEFSAEDRDSGLSSVIATLTETGLRSSLEVVSGHEPQPGVYEFSIEATDGAGNKAVSKKISFVVQDPRSASLAIGQGGIVRTNDDQSLKELISFIFEARFEDGRPLGKVKLQRQELETDHDDNDDNIDADNEIKTILDSFLLDWLVFNENRVRFQGRVIEDDDFVLYQILAQNSGAGPGGDFLEIKIWGENKDTDEKPDKIFRGMLISGDISAHVITRAGLDDVASFQSQYGINANLPSGFFLTQAQLDLLSLPATLEAVFSELSGHKCEMAPFSGTAERGGVSASFAVNLHSPFEGRAFYLLLGALPDGVQAQWDNQSGFSSAGKIANLTIRADLNAPPRSLNLLVVYNETNADGASLKNFCQFNVEVR